MASPLIEIRNLQTHFFTDSGIVRAVDGVDVTIAPGETLGMVGESGCGKSVTALSLMRLVDRPGRIVDGEILLRGDDLLAKSEREMHRIRGNEMSMIFQEPMTSLNPVHTVGKQISESLKLHQGLNDRQATARAVEMLEKVGLPDAARTIREYPYQLSGGMRQRAMIAMALSCNPRLLIADEPTTALDVTIQAQVLDVIRNLIADLGTSLLLITHDMAVVAEIADRVVVLYAGKVVELGSVQDIFDDPRHPYTRGLLVSMPQLSGDRNARLESIPGAIPDPISPPSGCKFNPRCAFATDICRKREPPLFAGAEGREVRCWIYSDEPSIRAAFTGRPEARSRITTGALDTVSRIEAPSAPITAETNSSAGRPLIAVRGLRKFFPIRRGIIRRIVNHVRAVDGIDFSINGGETLGLVGESGSGKTTTGRMVMRLLDPTEGSITYDGTDLTRLSGSALREMRRNIQIIFQDPFGSLDPRMTVREILEEPYIIHAEGTRSERHDRAAELLQTVGLPRDALSRYPHQFSGGQRQRLGIARAIALRPRLIVCDEPVSALDVSIQAQIINLLEDLQRQFGLTYLFVAHDLSVVRHTADHVAVMYLGKIVEYADTNTLFSHPLHPYTEALLSAVPIPDPAARRSRIILEGSIPSPTDPPPGCPFHTRCPLVRPVCRTEVPQLVDIGDGHEISCHVRAPSGGR